MQEIDHKENWGFHVASLFGLILLAAIPFLILCYFLIPLFSGTSFFDFAGAQDFKNPKYMHGLIVMQILYHTLLFILPGILFYNFFNRDKARFYGAFPSKKAIHYFLAIALLISSFGFVALLGDWNKLIPMPASWHSAESIATEATEAILNIKTFGQFLLTFFYIAILPGIGEELLFRGCIQQILGKIFHPKNMTWAIICTGILFGVMHGQMESVLPRIFLGVLLGYIFHYSGSLWPAILAHIFNNGLQVTLAYLSKTGKIKFDLKSLDSVPTWVGLISLMICLGILILFHKKRVALRNQDLSTKITEHNNELD
jgi:uncharacterized protein